MLANAAANADTGRAGRQRRSGALRALLKARLPPDALAPAAFEALDMALSFEAWTRLRDEQALSVDDAKAVLALLVAGILQTSDAA